MDLQNRQIAAAFSRHNFESSIPYLSDNIQWTMLGGEERVGMENVIQTCLQSKEYLARVKTNFTKFLVLEAGEHIVVDSICEYLDPDERVSKVASCDIFHFDQGRIISISSYCIELQ